MELARHPSLIIAVADLVVRLFLFGPVVFVAVHPPITWLNGKIATICLLVRRFEAL
jgi:hypothetical protein